MDELHKFLFDGLPVRGMLVRLREGWQALQAARATPYPAPVRTLLGQMCAAGVLMRANIKFEGALVLQVHGDGPVKLAVAEVRDGMAYRATAQVVGDTAGAEGLAALVNVHGQGRCAITLDPKDRHRGQQPYQGVVALHGDRREPLQKLSEVLEHYMLQSEQLDTRLVLAADEHGAAGLLIQRLPIEGAGNLAGASERVERSPDEARIGRDEDFNRIALLAATLTEAELLTLDASQLLHRLFWQEKLTRFAPDAAAPRFSCSCSRERVGAMLLGLGREEVDSIVAERGNVEIGCEFCGRQYHFDAVDATGLFTPGRDQPPVAGTVQ